MPLNLPCGSQSRPRPGDDVNWEAEKVKLGDKGWWVEKGKDGD